MFKRVYVLRLTTSIRFKSTMLPLNQNRVDAPETASEPYFKHVKMGQPDAMIGITEAYRNEENPSKINLGVGAYRSDDGMPWVLNCVREAELRVIANCMNKEYLPITGLKEFNTRAAELVFGASSTALSANRIATTQTLSGTGALRIASAFLAKFWRKCKEVYVPVPTWANHMPIFETVNLEMKNFRYFEPRSCGLDFKAMIEDIYKMPRGSIIMLNTCAHNPTGVDPDEDQWYEISQCIKQRQIYPFFDFAYQGFASGNPDIDAKAIRIFEAEGHQFCVAQSFAKNMGLYGERIGALHMVCSDEDEANRVLSQLKILIRPMYSSPPLHGARIVAEVLGNPELRNMWTDDVRNMAERIKNARQQLKDTLSKVGSTRNWDHITKQIGLFCYSGLSPNHVKRLRNQFAIYIARNGRMSMAGVTSNNVQYLAESMHAVTTA